MSKPRMTGEFEIVNPLGLHARAASKFSNLANKYKADVWISKDGTEVNGKSILELMQLCAPCESWISFRARGSDSDVLVARLADLVEAGFHESD